MTKANTVKHTLVLSLPLSSVGHCSLDCASECSQITPEIVRNTLFCSETLPRKSSLPRTIIRSRLQIPEVPPQCPYFGFGSSPLCLALRTIRVIALLVRPRKLSVPFTRVPRGKRPQLLTRISFYSGLPTSFLLAPPGLPRCLRAPL
jgi:hypothetical protein